MALLNTLALVGIDKVGAAKIFAYIGLWLLFAESLFNCAFRVVYCSSSIRFPFLIASSILDWPFRSALTLLSFRASIINSVTALSIYFVSLRVGGFP